MVSNKKININGWYNRHNAGDEAYKISFANIFKNNDLIFSDSPIDNADIYILGGGDVVTNSILEKFSRIDSEKYIISTTINKKIDFNLVKDFKKIIVRDIDSFNILKENNIDCNLIPDITFNLNYNNENGKNLIENYFKNEKLDLYKNKIGIILNCHLFAVNGASWEEWIKFEKFSNDLCQVIDSTNASFVFIPFGKRMPWDDRTSNSFVASKCKYWKKNLCIFDSISVQDTLDIVSYMDLCISTRLHSSIFSCISSVPFIDIIHNHKNNSFTKTINYTSNNIKYLNSNYESIFNKINYVLENIETEKEKINNISYQQKIILKDINNVLSI